MTERERTAIEIRAAYLDAEKALRRVGKLLRTTEAGRFMWATQHKTAVTGLCVVVKMLAWDAPSYAGDTAPERSKP